MSEPQGRLVGRVLVALERGAVLICSECDGQQCLRCYRATEAVRELVKRLRLDMAS